MLIIVLVILILPSSAYFLIKNQNVQNYLAQHITQLVSEKLDTEFTVESVNYTLFNKLELNNVYIADQQGDSLIHSNKITGNLDVLSLSKRELFFNKISAENANFRIYNDTTKEANIKFLIEALKRKDTTKPRMHLQFKDMELKNSQLKYYTNKPRKEEYGLDPNNIKLNNLNLSLENFEADHKARINFDLNKLSFIDHSGLELLNMNTHAYIDAQEINLSSFQLRSPNSFINADTINLSHKGFENFKHFTDKVDLKLDIQRSNISSHDLAFFSKVFHEIPENNIALEGFLEGKIKNLRGKDIYAATGNETELRTNFSADGLPDIDNTFLYIDIDQFSTGTQDLEIINNFSGKGEIINIPDGLSDIGLIRYSGNFTGFLEDFVTYGNLQTNQGNISTDLSIKPRGKEEFKINGNLETENFDISRLANNNQRFGKLSMDIHLNGTAWRDKGFQTQTDGTIKKLELNDYQYENIDLNGLLTNKKYEGALTINDPNINFDFSGGIDFSEKIPVFDFHAVLEEAKLEKLNFVEDDSTANLAFDITSNFKGNNLDNAQGNIQFHKGNLTRHKKFLNFDDIEINAAQEADSHRIFLTSKHIDASLIGKYQSSSVHQSLKNLFFYYMPAFIKQESDTAEVKYENNFELKVNLKQTDSISRIFMPELNISENSKIRLQYAGGNNTFNLKMHSDTLKYKSYQLSNLGIESLSQDTAFSLVLNLDNLHLEGERETSYLNNLTIRSLSGDDQSKIVVNWDDIDSQSSKGEFVALANFNKQENSENISSKIFFMPGELTLNNEKWMLEQNSITIDSSAITFDNFKFKHAEEQLSVDGKISKNPTDTLSINFSSIDLGYANILFPTGDIKLNGIINGQAKLENLYKESAFKTNLKIDSLEFNKQKLGTTKLLSEWSKNKEEIWLNLNSSRGDLRVIDVEGDYSPKSQMINFDISLDKLRLNFLNPILEENFSDVHGALSGHLKLQGTTQNPAINGRLIAQKAGLKVDYLQTKYNFTHTLDVSNNKILFQNTTMYDDQGNQANLDGSLFFKKLNSVYYDFTINADNFKTLNTNRVDNSMFYGNGFASGLINIKGNSNDNDLQIDASANTEKNTIINLPLGLSEGTEKSKFVTFKQNDYSKEEQQKEFEPDLSGLNLNFSLEITPEAQARLIFDPSIGDMITARGNGNLNMEVGQDGDFRIFGDYTIDEGDYMFSLKNVINKKFQIQQGSQIVWNGSPEDADINITAIYKLRTSLNNLLMDTTEFYNKRIPVECRILLTDKLVNPEINFEIGLPTADESTRAMVDGAIGTEEDLNKQFLSLLVLNTFMPSQQYMADQSDQFEMGATSMAFTTSELLSNQLSHWLSQISNNWDIGVNYQPGDEISKDQVEVALSTQLLNDRLIINGNVGTTGQQTQASEFVGDFRVDWKLSKNGKVRLKFFNRYSDRLIYEETRYIQGLGLFYREEFDAINELLEKNKKKKQ